MVLADTSIWSLALRQRPEHLHAQEQQLTQALAELIREGRVQMLGPIRQELLSGIREEVEFRKLRDYLRAFPEHPLEVADYEEAAHMHNRCRARGIAGSDGRFPDLRRLPPPRLDHSHQRSGFPEVRFGAAAAPARGLDLQSDQ